MGDRYIWASLCSGAAGGPAAALPDATGMARPPELSICAPGRRLCSGTHPALAISRLLARPQGVGRGGLASLSPREAPP